MIPFSLHAPDFMPRLFLKVLTVSPVCELPIRFYRISLLVGGQNPSHHQRVTPEIKPTAEPVPKSAVSHLQYCGGRKHRVTIHHMTKGPQHLFWIIRLLNEIKWRTPGQAFPLSAHMVLCVEQDSSGSSLLSLLSR